MDIQTFLKTLGDQLRKVPTVVALALFVGIILYFGGWFWGLLSLPIWIALLYVVGFLYYILSQPPNSRFGTIVEEGEIVVVMKSGNAHRYYGNIRDWKIDPITGVASYEEGYEFQPGFLGITWMGIPPFYQRYQYPFKWLKFDQKPGGSEYDFVPRDEVVDSLYFQYGYGVRIRGAETGDRIPVDMDLVVTTRVANAQIALFKANGNWLGQTAAAIESAGRDWIGEHSYKEVLKLQAESGKKKSGTTSLVPSIKVVNKKKGGNQPIMELFGNEIIAINVVSISISDGPTKDKILETTLQEYTAEQAAIVTRKTADATAYKTEVEGKATGAATLAVGGAEAEAIRLRFEAMIRTGGEQAGALAQAEALRELRYHQGALAIGNGVIPTFSLLEKDSPGASGGK